MTLLGVIPPGEGWGYVWAAYGIAWTAMLLYGVSLWWRLVKARGPNGPGGDA